MQLILKVQEKELNDTLLQTLKSLFKDKELTILVDDGVDETSYLLQNEANRQRLFQSVYNINKGENLTELNLDALKHSIDA